MAQGRYSRIDGQNSSNHCLIICMVGFVATCVLGAWMSTSSSNSLLRTGISVDQFMGGMPKVVTRSDPSVESQIAESKNEKQIEAEKELSPQGVNESLVSDENKGADESRSNDASHEATPDDGNDASHQDAPGKEIETMMQDRGIDQSEKSREVKKEGLNGDSSDRSSSSDSINTAPQPKVIAWPTQSAESEKEKLLGRSSVWKHQKDYRWKVCNVTAGPDYIPCLDNLEAIKTLKSTRHYEHRERHCPDEAPTCLVPLPKGYRTPVKWPKSRDMIWFVNAPHTKLAGYKGKQNWVKAYDRYLTFPGGGTQFVHGALHYIDYIQQTEPDIDWGKRTRVVLDVGCGVASFGGYLFDRDVITMSLAPKDEHEAQVQFALERGIPAISAVMGTKRLPFPSMVFDIVHCARCRVPWHAEGGKLLLELNRVLRPGGFFVWSATPVYRKGPEDTGIWKEMSILTKAMCWELVKVNRDVVNRKSAAIFRKTTSNDCYERRPVNNPPLCEESDDPNEAWYTPLQQCIHKVAKDSLERGFEWPATWPSRLEEPPYWLKDSAIGVSAKAFTDDYDSWKHVINNLYLDGIGMNWSTVRNVMDMNASYGGFAAALKDLKLWVMNVVPVNSSNTLPIIYERGLFGMYHDWCESFCTYPRSYDVLHADHLFLDLMKRCNFVSVMAEIDRILRPGGRLIVRDDAEILSEVGSMAKSLHWKITHYNDNEGVLCIMKTLWRPTEVETITGAIGIPRR